MHAHTTDGWGELFLAEAGASAALAGLLFVAISINLTKILEVRGLVGRAGEAILLLVTGLLAWSILVVIHARAVRGGIGPSRPVLVARVAMAQLAVLPFLVAGVSLLLRAGGGLYWLVPGVVMCLVVAVLNAWVLLIEILR
jgi:modulator of FtsH protease